MNLDPYKLKKQEMARKIDDLRTNKYLDFDTKLVVTDMMFYDAYADIYTIMII